LSEGVLNGFDADDQVGSVVSDHLTPAIEFINMLKQINDLQNGTHFAKKARRRWRGKKNQAGATADAGTRTHRALR
jgi:hypothetical protein